MDASLIGAHGVSDPGGIVANLGVNTRSVSLGTTITPGHNTLQLTAAYNWATRVTLQKTQSFISQ